MMRNRDENLSKIVRVLEGFGFNSQIKIREAYFIYKVRVEHYERLLYDKKNAGLLAVLDVKDYYEKERTRSGETV